MKIGFAVLLLALAGCGRLSFDRSAGEDPAAALIGWWKFDEGSGAAVADASGFGNTATLRNGGWGTGRDGGGLAMDGGNDGIVVVPLSDSLRSTASAITVMAWTYRTAEHNVAVIAHEYPTLFLGFHGPQFKWEIQGFRGRGVACYADPRYRAELERWIHLAATYDGWRARLYADGVEICSGRFWGWIGMPDSPFTLSGYLRNGDQIVDEITGMLDDVRIYNRALSEAQIRAVYREGR